MSSREAVGTASRSIWLINNRKDLQAAIHELERNGAFAEPVLVQELAAGHIEHAQAVFCEAVAADVHLGTTTMKSVSLPVSELKP
jgi:hypothetical protein